MVERLTEITLKYEGRAPTSLYDRRSTESLVNELKAVLERSEAARDRDTPDGTGNLAVSLLFPVMLELIHKLPTRIL